MEQRKLSRLSTWSGEEDKAEFPAQGISQLRHLNIPEVERYLQGRKIPGVAFPQQHLLTAPEVFGPGGVPNLQLLRDHFLGEGRLDNDCLLKIVTEASRVMAKENNVVYVNGLVKVIGPVCGQFFDLVEIMKKIDVTGGEKCVFLGKYAWDGCFNTETLLYLYAFKLAYPDRVTLLRSQRETRLCAKTTFKRECIAKYHADVYEHFCSSFEHLPLVAIVNRDNICVHGGLSPTALSLAEINKINRFEEPAPRGALTDLLWSDPDPTFGKENNTLPCFTFNTERKISVYFTYVAFKNFMKRNGLFCLIRGNQPLSDGFYEYPMPQQTINVRPLSMKAIFSSPNFKGKRNPGALLVLTPYTFHVEKFLWVSSPYWLPNFADCLTWSLPFLVRKVTLFVSDLLELMDRDTAASDVKAALKKNQERSNVLAVRVKEPGEGPSATSGDILQD